jgi:hypothetical protein
MVGQDYLNFELQIDWRESPIPTLRIRLISSPAGTATLEIQPPVTEEEINSVLGALHGATKITNSERARLARAFGEKLFTAIFSGSLYTAYMTSLERAASSGLRLRLNLDNAGPFANVPWELLRDPRSDYLCLSRQTQIVRYIGGGASRPLLEVTLPLQTLLLVAAPSDGPRMNVENEAHLLDEATHETRNRGLLNVERLNAGNIPALQHGLHSGIEYHIFHYSGASIFDDRAGEGLLAFEAPDGRTLPVSGEVLARELSEQKSLRLVMLRARPAEPGHDPMPSIAARIAARGMPAIVAMQYNLSDDAMSIFAAEFYTAIAEGYPIEQALSEARRSMASTLNNLEWATPGLYLRANTGVLFPRRPVASVSTGGLLDLLRSRAPAVIGVLVALVLLIFVISRALPKAGASTPTATIGATLVPTTTANVDLLVTSLRYFPDKPAPGQLVTVTIVVRNNGKDRSAPFKIAWYADVSKGTNTPDQVVPVDGLSPNVSLNVAAYYIFTTWGTFSTQAWVNYDGVIAETNLGNNLSPVTKLDISQDQPLTIDFTLLPDTSRIAEAQPFSGNEYASWGLHFTPDSGCATPMQISVQSGENLLIVTPVDKASVCRLSFKSDAPIGGVQITFTNATPGSYSLELRDANGKRITGSNQINPSSNTVAITTAGTDGREVVFSGPAPYIIKQVAFAAPGKGF